MRLGHLGLYLGFQRPGGGGGGAEAPALVTPTVITGTAVVGETLTATDPTFASAPSGIAYQWKRGGANIGGATSSTYVLVDDDAANATRGTITCQATASFAGGAVSASTSAATSMPRRTYPTLAIRTGRRTKQNYGGVAYTSPTLKCLGIGASTSVTWTRAAASPGTDGHWVPHGTNPTITPIPSAAGVTAQLSDASYAFVVTATFGDTLVEQVTLTVTPAANVQTWAPRDGFSNQTFATTHYSSVGTVVEIATGAEFGGTGNRFTITAAPASRVTFRPADSTRLPALGMISISSGGTNVEVDGFKIRADASVGFAGSGISAGVYITNTGSAPVDVILRNLDFVGDKAYHFTNWATLVYAIRMGTSGTLLVEDCDVHVAKGLFTQDVPAGDAGNTTVTLRRCKTRYFWDNGVLAGTGSATYTNTINVEDCWFASGFRTTGSALHQDVFQRNNADYGSTFNITRCWYAQADGDAYTQTLGTYYNRANTGVNISPPANPLHKMNVNGFIDFNRAWMGISLNCSAGSVYDHYTGWKTPTGGIQNPTEDTPVSGGPWFDVGNGAPIAEGPTNGPWSGTNELKNSIFFGTITDPATRFTQTNNQAFSATASSRPADSGLVSVDPYADSNLEDWEAMSIDDMDTWLRANLRPRSGQHTNRGALNEDGTWRA